ncbi:ABC transporter permease [uncultured Imperialibacter sp.]|uniref:ABC transporter permease n=1 Tax=uncultured Imperialibacter sp. TaxID=1672639 RepID=UPI0030D8E705|tara:strand:+ start:109307 stop:110170 length:864 start_codon:yes stop_codon:yes gene_type:complete
MSSLIIEKEEKWDLVIEPQSGLLDLKLRDVWRYRDLLKMFVKRDFISFYKQTILGPLWFFIQPLFTVATYTIIFGGVAGIATDGLPKPLFYLAGITAWTYFADCLTKTSTVFTVNAKIFGKVYFPRLVMPLSIIISNLVRFGVQLGLFLLMYLGYYVFGTQLEPTIYLVIFPVLVLIMASFGMGLGMIVSSLTTKYRDMALLVQFGTQLLMYSTTVVYPLSRVPERYKVFFEWNPIVQVIEGFRLGFLGKGEFNFQTMLIALIISLGTLFIGVVFFNRVEKNFVDTI